LPVGISSCIPALTSSLGKLPHSVEGLGPLAFVSASATHSLRVNYDNLSTLGPDRIANALYTQKAFPTTPRIVISAGTAVVVDGITAQGTFIGGAILPGPTLQLESLHAGTAALPRVSQGSLPIKLPGTSTEQCIRSGVLFGIAGAVSLLVDRLRDTLGNNVAVVSCGGAWPMIENEVTFSSVHVPYCTVIGAALSTKKL
ncbi:MAG: type III pantothenate kinase, partial [Chitinivibrionales bacterium]|nr:type III pantothenate kinase [Chitinivibrionales bacterium]MBD3356589.1 type III pantothenate kinase [Chitinivibrionales bacterium]